MMARLHISVIAVCLIVSCVAYLAIAIISQELARAIGVGFFAFVIVATVALRLLRRF